MDIANKAFRYINKGIEEGKELDENSRREMINRLAESAGTPEAAEAAMGFLSKRFDETGIDEV